MIAQYFSFSSKCEVFQGRLQGSRRPRKGFTLIELLIVLFILMLLAAVALPNIRRVLLDQKTSRASRSLVSFIDVARSRAIAEGREIGVRFERLAGGDANDDLGLAASIRVRQLNGVPPYSGESSDAVMVLTDELVPFPGVDTATFQGDSHQLLVVSAQMVQNGTPALAPIQANRDRIELPGGKVVRISTLEFFGGNVRIRFDLRDAVDSTLVYPSGAALLSDGQHVKYRIHRAPNPSSSITLSLPRGVVVDLNYSGIGPRGNQFIPTAGNISPVDIVFGPDGRITNVRLPSGIASEPSGQVFICVGDFDGVRPGSLLANTGRDRSNLFREKTVWLVMNQYTGRVFSSPIAPITPAVLAGGLQGSLQQARTFATLADTVEGI